MTALSSTSSGDFDSPATSVPPRTKKHQGRKMKRKRKKKKWVDSSHSGGGSVIMTLTEREVCDEVSQEYLNGGKRGRAVLGSNEDCPDSRRDRTKVCGGHQEHLQKLNRHPSLVLNADYQPLSNLPLSVWSWQDTVKAVFGGKVTVVDVYPGVFIRAVNLEIALPSVIAMNEYIPQNNQRPAFTRRNVFLRDGYRCQYCSQLFHTKDLSLDHYVPRCMGGRLNWENAVTSCKKCNGRKGSLLPSDLHAVGMKVLCEPRVPTKYDLAAVADRMLPRRVHPTWALYLGHQAVSDIDPLISSDEKHKYTVDEDEIMMFDV